MQPFGKSVEFSPSLGPRTDFEESNASGSSHNVRDYIQAPVKGRILAELSNRNKRIRKTDGKTEI